jgi:hypothetical protein
MKPYRSYCRQVKKDEQQTTRKLWIARWAGLALIALAGQVVSAPLGLS